MKSKKVVNNLVIYIFILIIVILLKQLRGYETSDTILFFSIVKLLETAICIGTICHFAITIKDRIMNKNVRLYLFNLVTLEILWVLFRDVKWKVFEYLDNEARFMWYLFYIPMLLIPLLCFFLSLHIGKKEDYKINRKWYFLVIPIIVSIVLVLSNDIHQFVFMFNPNFENWDNDYKYNIGYYIVIFFSIILVLATIISIKTPPLHVASFGFVS